MYWAYLTKGVQMTPESKSGVLTRGRLGRIVAAAAGTVVLTTALVATPALADVYQERDGGYGYVRDGRLRVGACDEKADGLGVTTYYKADNGTGGNVGDWNGEGGGCGEEGPDHGGRIISFHVCVGSRCGPEKPV